MADNVTANSGSGGATFRTDDDGTAHWPYTKIAFGADNTQTIVGSISSNPLPVALSATDNAVLDTINTAAVAVQAAVEGTLTVGSHAVTNAGTFAVQVDGDALTALQLIDDVIYVDDADWTDGSSKHLLTGGVYQSSPQTITDGDVGPFQVTANGYLITSINGTVTVGSHAVTNAGTFVVQEDGAALTALQLIDNVVYTHDAAGGTAVGNMMMAQRDDEVGSTATTTADGDAQALTANKFGQLKTTQLADATSEIKFAIIDAASSGDNTIQAAAGAGVKIRVLSVMAVAAGTVNARFESGAGGTALTGQMNLVANTGFVLPFNPGGWFETADNTLLNLELSAAISVDGCLTYVEV